MNKAILEFDLKDGKEQFLIALHSGAMHSNMEEIYSKCRSVLKHSDLHQWSGSQMIEFVEDIKGLANIDVLS